MNEELDVEGEAENLDHVRNLDYEPRDIDGGDVMKCSCALGDA